MAAIDWDDVVAYVPALDAVDPLQQTLLLDLANTWLNVAVFGGEDSAKVKMLRILIAAHFASLPGNGVTSGGGTTAGPVKREKTSQIEREYADVASGGDGAAGFSETVWGRRYLAIVRSTPRARFPRVA